MKKAFMLLGLAALVLATSCEREDLNKVSNNSQKTFEGDVAYIVVNINDVNDVATRATSSGFEYGTSDEYAVNDAHFYFYGSDGEFVAESDDTVTGEVISDASVGNIEWKGNTLVALHGLSGTSYPNWVVTVLNQPAGFVAPAKLDDFPTTLAETNAAYGTPGEYKIYTKGVVEIIGDSSYDVGGDLDGSGKVYYTMCTSSFDPTTGSEAADAGYSSTYYFATPVTSDNFALEEISSDGEGGYVDANEEPVPPITIYVERLVAKTRVGVSSDLSGTTIDGVTYYEIEVEEDVDGVATPTNLYVRLDGWILNGVSNNTYMAKQIDPSWGTASPFDWDWNEPANYRSYWAMSTAYGDTSVIWPTTSSGYEYGSTDAKNMNEYLRWFDLDPDWLHQIGVINAAGDYDYEYCGENTNTAMGSSTTGVIYTKRSTAITNALISATIGEINDGVFTGLDLVRENGILYTKEGYLNYAASHIYLYTKEEDVQGETVFTRISPDYLTLEDKYDGYVHVVLDSEALSAASITVLYETTDEGDTGDTIAQANTYIENHFNALYGYGANGYNGGAMYYSIPIEHLNNAAGSYTTGDEHNEEEIDAPAEANYGIVRNHIYSLTITGIENIGWGVWNPEEVIIPQEDIDTYSLTCQINILSWKLVEQSVTL